jgi:hypothetical protein
MLRSTTKQNIPDQLPRSSSAKNVQEQEKVIAKDSFVGKSTKSANLKEE